MGSVIDKSGSKHKGEGCDDKAHGHGVEVVCNKGDRYERM
jgi:hypothetical protein